MVAYKNNPSPGQEKTYQKYDYRLPSVIRPLHDNSMRQNDIPVSDESIDRLIGPHVANEFYQRATETHPTRQRTYPTSRRYEYDLAQPIWFYMIMKKLAAKKR